MSEIKEEVIALSQVLGEDGQPLPQPESILTTTSGATPIAESKELTVEEMLKSEEYQLRAYGLAMQMFDILGSKTHTLERIVVKTKTQPMAIFQKLKLLEMFGYCLITRGDSSDPKQRNETVFQLAISMQDKIKALKEIIKKQETELASLKSTLLAWEANSPKPSFSSTVVNPE